MSDYQFTPATLRPVAGDTVNWQWAGAASHNVTAYAGATFASPTQVTGTFSQVFNGGTVKYRCTLHSLLNSDGSCTGMCGVLTDDPNFDNQPPTATIAAPAWGSPTTQPFVVSGTADDDLAVDKIELDVQDQVLLTQPVAVLPVTVASPAAHVDWSVNVDGLRPGLYELTAVATDRAGNRGQSATVLVAVA